MLLMGSNTSSDIVFRDGEKQNLLIVEKDDNKSLSYFWTSLDINKKEVKLPVKLPVNVIITKHYTEEVSRSNISGVLFLEITGYTPSKVLSHNFTPGQPIKFDTFSQNIHLNYLKSYQITLKNTFNKVYYLLNSSFLLKPSFYGSDYVIPTNPNPNVVYITGNPYSVSNDSKSNLVVLKRGDYNVVHCKKENISCDNNNIHFLRVKDCIIEMYYNDDIRYIPKQWERIKLYRSFPKCEHVYVNDNKSYRTIFSNEETVSNYKAILDNADKKLNDPVIYTHIINFNLTSSHDSVIIGKHIFKKKEFNIYLYKDICVGIPKECLKNVSIAETSLAIYAEDHDFDLKSLAEQPIGINY